MFRVMSMIFRRRGSHNQNITLQNQNGLSYTVSQTHRLFGLGFLSKFTGCRHVQMSKTPVFAIKANFSNYSVKTVKSGNYDALFTFGT